MVRPLERLVMSPPPIVSFFCRPSSLSVFFSRLNKDPDGVDREGSPSQNTTDSLVSATDLAFPSPGWHGLSS